MTEIIAFQEHLNELTKADWQKLFDVLAEIKPTEEFGTNNGMEKSADGVFPMPYWEWSEVTDKFFKVVHRLGLVPDFDWTKWKKGKLILNRKNEDFNKHDTVTLCMLFTVIIRADRFSDGVLVANFRNGTIPQIIKVLQNRILI